MTFIMFINVNLLTIFGILIFINSIKTQSECNKHDNKFIFKYEGHPIKNETFFIV